MSLAYIEHYTYDDYKNWDGKWELINGVAYAMTPSPMIPHQTIIVAVTSQLYEQLEDCEKCLVLAEEDWKISEDTVLKPDIMIVCDEKNLEYVTKTPELVVEVISKSSALRDEKYKFSIYEKEKVKYYILIYPHDKKGKIYKLKDAKYEKVGDFFNEVYEFDDLTCKVKIDFDKVFKKLKK